MDSNELKNKLSKLWKDTFHDNDDYISLVFNNYYDPRFSFERHHDAPAGESE